MLDQLIMHAYISDLINVKGDISLSDKYPTHKTINRLLEITPVRGKILVHHDMRVCVTNHDKVIIYKVNSNMGYLYRYELGHYVEYFVPKCNYFIARDRDHKFNIMYAGNYLILGPNTVVEKFDNGPMSKSTHQSKITKYNMYKLSDDYIIIRHITEITHKCGEVMNTKTSNYIINLESRRCVDVIYQEGLCKMDNRHKHVLIYDKNGYDIMYDFTNQKVIHKSKRLEYIDVEDDVIVFKSKVGLHYKEVKFTNNLVNYHTESESESESDEELEELEEPEEPEEPEESNESEDSSDVSEEDSSDVSEEESKKSNEPKRSKESIEHDVNLLSKKIDCLINMVLSIDSRKK